MIRDAMAAAAAALAVLGLVIAAVPVGGAAATPRPRVGPSATDADPSANDSVLGNFSAALGRIVTLIGAAGGALLAIVWARVALSWFSNDVTKKVQAKDRARDALVGTLIFAAALSGIIWGLAHWVLTGT
jgi:hypothetical protein